MSDRKSSSEVLSLKKEASVSTDRSRLYMKRLCKHFQRKVEAQWYDNFGKVTFEEGVCFLAAHEHALEMRCEAQTSNELLEVIDTMERHLIRFMRKDSLVIEWKKINDPL